MKVVDQNIPAELYGPYVNTLGQAAVWHPGSDVRTLKRREWYELIHSKSPPKGAPSAAQLAVRAAFKKCVNCFNASPKTGGVEPPAIGYRSKEWWYAASGELTWPDYIGEKKISWDGNAADPYQLKDSNYDYHDANWFLKTDEADFISFYDEMKTKYGYPWSAKNSSDQIVAKMNKIVCNEIEYDAEGDMTVAFTPGQTAQARKGVCDDQSILHYALTHKALKEIGWSDGQIDEKLGVLINERGDKGHVYNWWKSINGTTRIVENTYDPGDAPSVVGDMKYWGADQPYYLIQLFNKTGHTDPWFIGNGDIYALWYYNYFIHKSWGFFYADKIPDWCGCVIPVDHTEQCKTKYTYFTYNRPWDEAWAWAYAKYLTLSWVDGYTPDAIACYGNAFQYAAGDYKAVIRCSKSTLVFKPEDHMTKKKWDDVGIVKIIFERLIYDPPNETGGGIRVVETDETQDQVNGFMTFYIPKELCDFEEFSLTIEGLCRTSDDLRPLEPPVYGNTTRGTNAVGINQAKLYCA